jgi:carbonic anhydrase
LCAAAPGAGEGLAQFKKGFMRFKQEVISRHPAHFAELAASQSPKVMVVACCDSRVDPALLMGAGPGDIFIVRYGAAARSRAASRR